MGLSRREMMRASVDLPEPVRPTRARISPRFRVRSTPSSARILRRESSPPAGKSLHSPSTSRISSAGASVLWPGPGRPGSPATRALVAGWEGDPRTLAAGPSSTRRPASMTPMRSQVPAMRDRSWVMSRTEKPRRALRSRTSSMISRWTTTSRAVVGSSRMSRRGSSARAMAMTTRWRCPPESWWGWERRRPVGTRTASSSSAARSSAGRRRRPSWVVRTSAICSRMVMRGLRAFMAAWGTRATSRQRSRRSSPVSRAGTSCPLTVMRPPVMRAVGPRSRMIAAATVVLPQPEGPARPTTSPRPTVRLNRSTPTTRPPAPERSPASYSTLRSSMCRTGSGTARSPLSGSTGRVGGRRLSGSPGSTRRRRGLVASSTPALMRARA